MTEGTPLADDAAFNNRDDALDDASRMVLLRNLATCAARSAALIA